MTPDERNAITARARELGLTTQVVDQILREHRHVDDVIEAIGLELSQREGLLARRLRAGLIEPFELFTDTPERI